MFERNLLHLLDEIMLANGISVDDAVSSASNVFFMCLRRYLEFELGLSVRPTSTREVFQRKDEMDGHLKSLIKAFLDPNSSDGQSTISILVRILNLLFTFNLLIGILCSNFLDSEVA